MSTDLVESSIFIRCGGDITCRPAIISERRSPRARGWRSEARAVGPVRAWGFNPGSGDVNGNFTITSVPDGDYLLNLGSTYVLLENRSQLDLDEHSSIRTATLTTLTPTVSSDPPSRGQAESWKLSAIPASDDGTTTLLDGASATIVIVPGDELPPGVLAKKSRSFFALTTISCPSCDYPHDKVRGGHVDTLSSSYRTPAQ